MKTDEKRGKENQGSGGGGRRRKNGDKTGANGKEKKKQHDVMERVHYDIEDEGKHQRGGRRTGWREHRRKSVTGEEGARVRWDRSLWVGGVRTLTPQTNFSSPLNSR